MFGAAARFPQFHSQAHRPQHSRVLAALRLGPDFTYFYSLAGAQPSADLRPISKKSAATRGSSNLSPVATVIMMAVGVAVITMIITMVVRTVVITMIIQMIVGMVIVVIVRTIVGMIVVRMVPVAVGISVTHRMATSVRSSDPSWAAAH